MGKESNIEKTACRYARQAGFYVRKFSSPSCRGVPDQLFISPKGEVFFIEFKAPGKEPTALQLRELKLIRKNKGNAYWSDSIECAKNIIDCFK